MTVRIIPQTPSAHGFPLLIKNILRTPLIYYPEREIVYRDIMKYTYKELNQRVQRLANALESLGVRQGDTVAVMEWDSHRYLECYFAIPMMGAVLHTINIRLPPEQLIYTINHAEDDIILINADFLPLLAAVKDQMKTVKKIILFTDTSVPKNSPVELDGEYENLLATAAPGYDFPDFDENAMATTFYTTGTTGAPKGVYFSHRQIMLHTYGLMASGVYESQAHLSSGDVYMPMTPMFHVHAWGFPFSCTLSGMKQVYPGKYEPEMLLKLIVTHKVTFSHCVPTIIHMLVNSPAIKQVDLSNWKVAIGGSALPQGLCKAALENGINIYSGYGMSETCPVLTLALFKPHMFQWEPDQQVEIRCRTGLPMTNVNLEVVDLDGNPLPHDGKTTGEVVVRAPWLTQGYVKDPEQSEQLWKGGWLHTGDLGFIDPEGYLQLTDRLKDVIKTGGEWISSIALEDIISQHPAVSEAAVIGVPDPKWSERPLALVVLMPGTEKETDAAKLKDFFSRFAEEGKIPNYGVPDRVEIVDTIPKTSVGKINKKKLREMYR